MFKVRVSVGLVASASIRTAFSTLYLCNATAIGPFFYQQAAVNVISRRPDSGESENQSEFVTLFLAEHFANGVGIAPQVFGGVTLNLFAVFCRQQQVLDIAIVSVHLQRADTFVFFAG